MATTKKSHTTKKTTAKKAPVRRKSSAKRAKAKPLTARFYIVTIGIFVISVATVLVIALLTASIVMKSTNKARLDRINTIYASLNLGDDYKQTNRVVFGDKRPYDYDKDRTHSSYVEYVHPDTVSNTVADLDQKIKAAGFTFVDEPYAGSVFVQYHYKNADGEFIRLNVSSKPYNDATFNSYALNGKISDKVFAMDKNAGPAQVTIKVNLDDNNE